MFLELMVKPRLILESFRLLGSGLCRPEGICADPRGYVWAADQNTFLAKITPDGLTARVGRGGNTPNGLALDMHGRVVVAEYQHGSLQRFDPYTGVTETIARTADGRRVSRANYPAIDGYGRIWCTSSTGMEDDFAALRIKADDGFVFALEANGEARIVADGLHFANGLAFSKDFSWLYIVESSTKRIARASVLPAGRLGKVELFGPELEATPDGIAMDEDDNLWVTLLLEKSALVVLDRSANVHTVVEDSNNKILGRPTNVSFGGSDMRDLYVGSLDLDGVLRARVEIPGVPLVGQLNCGGRTNT
jgi:gluconolactonase